MRGSSLYRLILLLCSLAVADAVKCDISLVRGVKLEEIALVPENKDDPSSVKYLFCSKGGNSLKEMRFNSQPLSDKNNRITCDMNSGWMDDKIKLAEADAPLTVSCREYCVSKGPVHVEKYGDVYPVVPDYKVSVSCANPNFTQLMYNGKPVGMDNSNIELCDATGWPNLPGHPDGSTPIQFECRSDPVKCDISLVKGVTPEEIALVPENKDDPASIKYLFCSKGGNSLKEMMFNSQPISDKNNRITCDMNSGWMDGKRKLAEADAPLTVSCREYCVSTGPVNVGRYGHEFPVVPDWGVAVACSDKHFPQLMYKGKPVGNDNSNTEYCNATGWPYLHDRPDGSTPIHFECRAAPCWASVRVVDRAQYDRVTQTLTCKHEEYCLVAIEFGSKLYDSLKCNELNEWIGGQDKIADTSNSLNATCVNYCQSTGSGIKVKNIGNDEIAVFCSNPAHSLFHGETHIRSHASCNLEGWMMFDDSMDNKRNGDSLTPVQFECRADPTATTTTASHIITKRPRVKTTASPLTAETEEDDGDGTVMIMIGCSIGAFILGVVAAVTIAKVFCANDKGLSPEEAHTSRKAMEEGRRKRDRRGDDTTLDDDSVSSVAVSAL